MLTMNNLVSGTARNNLFYDCGAGSGVTGFPSHDSNWFRLSGTVTETNIQNGNADPFVNLAGDDYHLTSASNAGAVLVAPYNLDLDGHVRGTDGVWDRGAYEFISGSPPANACDMNSSGATDVSDVQLCANQAIGAVACSTGDINKDGACNVVDVQRVVNAALGGTCVSP